MWCICSTVYTAFQAWAVFSNCNVRNTEWDGADGAVSSSLHYVLFRALWLLELQQQVVGWHIKICKAGCVQNALLDVWEGKLELWCAVSWDFDTQLPTVGLFGFVVKWRCWVFTSVMQVETRGRFCGPGGSGQNGAGSSCGKMAGCSARLCTEGAISSPLRQLWEVLVDTAALLWELKLPVIPEKFRWGKVVFVLLGAWWAVWEGQEHSSRAQPAAEMQVAFTASSCENKWWPLQFVVLGFCLDARCGYGTTV